MRTRSIVGLLILLFFLLTHACSLESSAHASTPHSTSCSLGEPVQVGFGPRTSAAPPPPPPPPPPPDDGDPPPPTPPPDENGGGGCGGGATDNVIVIVVDVGEFSQGTNPPQPVTTDLIVVDLVNGIGQSQSVGIVSVSTLPFLNQENELINAGEIDPSTAVSYTPYAGYGVGYSVSVTEHVSGDQSSPNSVGMVTVTVKDSQGNVVFTNQVTGWGGNFAPIEDQASSNLNAFFNSIITQNEECPIVPP